MVKAPKYWKSGPDHPDTELAYITKAEKDLILKSDLHGSLSKGPNRGPSGIISLNSAGSGYSGSGSSGGGGSPHGGGGGGGGGGWDPAVAAREQAAREASQRSRIQQEKQAELDSHRAKAIQDEQAATNREQAAQRSGEEAAKASLLSAPVRGGIRFEGGHKR